MEVRTIDIVLALVILISARYQGVPGTYVDITQVIYAVAAHMAADKVVRLV